MKAFFVFSLLFVFSVSVFSQVSQEGVLSSANTTRSINSAADWYTHKRVKDISALGAVITVSTQWPNLSLKGFYNPRTDSTGWITYITMAGDTATYSIATSSGTNKLPKAEKVITASSTDSLIFLFQYK